MSQSSKFKSAEFVESEDESSGAEAGELVVYTPSSSWWIDVVDRFVFVFIFCVSYNRF